MRAPGADADQITLTNPFNPACFRVGNTAETVELCQAQGTQNWPKLAFSPMAKILKSETSSICPFTILVPMFSAYQHGLVGLMIPTMNPITESF